MTPAIRIAGVTKRFRSLQALAGVDLEVAQGEFFGLLGPNGAGKTTLISSLSGLARPDSGTLEVMGHDVVRDYRAARMALGVVPQELVFDPFFSVREMLVLQSGYFGIKKNDDWIDEILHHLDLTTKANANMRMLSGGMKRRVLVAQALVHRPPVIVLDEPTAGVDVELRQGLWTFIRKLNQDGHTIVLTTHYLEEAETLCNRIAMLKQGRLIALEDKDALMGHGAARRLNLRLKAALPESLAPLLVSQRGDMVELKLAECAELEGILAELARAGVGIHDIEVSKPDLEEIFVKMMRNSEAPR